VDKAKHVAIYHAVLEGESCQKARQDLTDMVRDAEAKNPGKPRALFLDIDGHRNSAGGWDNEAEELQYWVLDRLLPFLTEATVPMVKVENGSAQDNLVPACAPPGKQSSAEGRFVRLDGKPGNDLSHWSAVSDYPEWRKADMAWASRLDADKDVGKYYLRDLGRDEGETIQAYPWTVLKTKVMVVLGRKGTLVRVPCAESTKGSGTGAPFWERSPNSVRHPAKPHRPGMLLVADKQLAFSHGPGVEQGLWALPRNERRAFAKHVVASLTAHHHYRCIGCDGPFEERSPTLRVVHWRRSPVAAPEPVTPWVPVAGFVHPGCQDALTQIDSFTAFFRRSKTDLRTQVLLGTTSMAAALFYEYSEHGEPSGDALSQLEPYARLTSGRDMINSWDEAWAPLRDTAAVDVIKVAIREIAADPSRFEFDEETGQIEFEAPPHFDEVAEYADFDLESFLKDAIAGGLRKEAGLCANCDEKIELGEIAWDDGHGWTHCTPECARVPAVDANQLRCWGGRPEDWVGATEEERHRHWVAAAIVHVMQVFGDLGTMSGEVSDDAGFDPGHPSRFLAKTMRNRSKQRSLFKKIGLDRFGAALTSEEVYQIFHAYCVDGRHPWACPDCGIQFAAEWQDSVPPLDWSCPECNEWPEGLPPDGTRVRALKERYYAVVENSGTLDEDTARKFAAECEDQLNRGSMDPVPAGSVGIVFEAYQASSMDHAGEDCLGPFTGHVTVAFPKSDQPLRVGTNLHSDRYNTLWRGQAMKPEDFEILDTPCTKSAGCWGGYACSAHRRAFRPLCPLGISERPKDPLLYSITLHQSVGRELRVPEL
jgi:hypothetical protein